MSLQLVLAASCADAAAFVGIRPRLPPARTIPVMTAYSREPSDTASVDVAAVEALLDERDSLRSARNWNAADSVRDSLQGMGVAVYDNEQTWRVAAGEPSEAWHGRHIRESAMPRLRTSAARHVLREASGRSYTPPPGDGLGGGERAPRRGGASSSLSPRRRETQSRRESQARRLATRNQAYARSAECGATLEPELVAKIEGSVQLRLRKKLDRRYDEADKLLAELGAEHGVAVSDDLRQWRADGKSFVYTYAEHRPTAY